MRLVALLAIVAVLVVGCGAEPGSKGTEVVSPTSAPATTSEPGSGGTEVVSTTSASATTSEPGSKGTEVVSTTSAPPTETEPSEDVPAAPAGLAHCDDVPRLGSRFEGKLGARQNPDPIVGGVLATYANEHPDTFGGRWIDRDNGGALVLGFTDDPEPHRQAILARAPSPDDDVGVRPRPPITDARPLGERDDVVIDVVQVQFSETELADMADRVRRAIAGRDFGLDGSGTYTSRQRVSLDLVNPPEGALDEIAELVPDPSAVCVEVTRTPQPPAGPLDVIPDLSEEDPLVSCPGTPAVRYSQMIDPPSINEVDHPAVDVLRAELDTPVGEPLPRGRWVVISIDDDSATFAALSSGGFGVAGIERRGDRWIFSGEAAGPLCEPAAPLPPGLSRVEVRLDVDSMPTAADTNVDVLVTEQGCAGGREMGDALRGPQVIETDEAVLVAFAVVPVAGLATCPDNPPTAVTVELSEPLGRRWVYDGLHFPPKPLIAVADPLTSTEYRDTFPCLSGSTFAARNRPDAAASGTEGPEAFETANRALLAHLGDLSEPLYDFEVAERGFGYDKWRIAVEDSDGAIHLGRVQAARTDGDLWQIEQARWCLTDADHSDNVKRNLMRERDELQPPAAFSECPMRSDTPAILYAEDAEGRKTPGELLSDWLNPMPVASYRIDVVESSDSTVRWQITMPGEPWGLTYGKMIVARNDGWWLHTFEWCHMEPDRL